MSLVKQKFIYDEIISSDIEDCPTCNIEDCIIEDCVKNNITKIWNIVNDSSKIDEYCVELSKIIGVKFSFSGYDLLKSTLGFKLVSEAGIDGIVICVYFQYQDVMDELDIRFYFDCVSIPLPRVESSENNYCLGNLITSKSFLIEGDIDFTPSVIFAEIDKDKIVKYLTQDLKSVLTDVILVEINKFCDNLLKRVEELNHVMVSADSIIESGSFSEKITDIEKSVNKILKLDRNQDTFGFDYAIDNLKKMRENEKL